MEHADATADLSHLGRSLPTMSIARGLLESVAAFNHVAVRLRGVVDRGKIQEVHDFLHAATFAARLDELVKIANDPATKATNILTQIDALKKHRASVREDYDFLSEYAHPNSLGTFLFFGRHDRASDTVRFRSDGWEPADAFKWVGVACSTLAAAADSADEMEAQAKRISDLGRAALPHGRSHNG